MEIKRMRDLREDHDKTQQEIAEEIGIGRRSVGNCLESALKKIRKNF